MKSKNVSGQLLELKALILKKVFNTKSFLAKYRLPRVLKLKVQLALKLYIAKSER